MTQPLWVKDNVYLWEQYRISHLYTNHYLESHTRYDARYYTIVQIGAALVVLSYYYAERIYEEAGTLGREKTGRHKYQMLIDN